MTSKSFSTKKPALVFDIDGEEFEAIRRMPGALFVEFTRRRKDATEEELASLMYEGFAGCMSEADFERFWKRCKTDVDIETMMEVFQFLAASFANGLPTKPSSPSAAGRRRARATGASSGAASVSKASTSENSAT